MARPKKKEVEAEATEVMLVDANRINAMTLFASVDSIDPLLRQIEQTVLSVIPDITTAKGRDAIASLAYRVSQSKVTLDDAGKQLVADWKSKAKLVDESRKHARDFLDNLRDEVRKPLTDWEELQAAIAKAEQDAKDEALRLEAERLESERLAREEAVKAERDAMAAQLAAAQAVIKEQEEKAAKAEAEKLALERQAEREAAIKADAEAKAKHEADALVSRAEAQAKAAVAQAQKEAQDAIDAAAAKAAQEEKAKLDAQRAADLAAQEAKRIAEKAAANKEHRRKVNSKALAGVIACGFTEEQGKSLITAILAGKVSNITINY